MADALFLVAFEGNDQHVADFAVAHAKRQGARLHIIHVLEWSPYTFLTPEELAQRHKMREAELKKAQESILVPAIEKLRAAGVEVTGEVHHGKPVDVICALAQEKGATLIITGRSTALSDRVFGSVASGLSQCATVPVVIVP